MHIGTLSGKIAGRSNAVHKVSPVSRKVVSPEKVSSVKEHSVAEGGVSGSSPRGEPEPPHDQFQGPLAKAI